MTLVKTSFPNVLASVPLPKNRKRPAHRSQSKRSIGSQPRRHRIMCSNIDLTLISDDTLTLFQAMGPVEMLRAMGEGQLSFSNLFELAFTTAGSVITFVYAIGLPPGVLFAFLDVLVIGPIDRILDRLAISFSLDDLKVVRTVGQGNFGAVYEGLLNGSSNGAGEKRVIIKRVKKANKGAEELAAVELYMNRRIRRNIGLRSVCAQFLGSFDEVDQLPLGNNAATEITLLWRFEGDETLENAISRRNFPLCLEEPILGNVDTNASGLDREIRVVQEILWQILICVRELHRQGIVHRDIKPSNLLITEGGRARSRIKAIDMGAATDLRTGVNYTPDESLLDPLYSPPEIYVLPTKTPKVSFAPLAIILSPVLWSLNCPDRFDMYSVGIVFLQLAIPELRTRGSLETLRRALRGCDYDLSEWRIEYGGRMNFDILDANGRAGWNLVCKMVRRRNTVQRGRISANGALSDKFFGARALNPFK